MQFRTGAIRTETVRTDCEDPRWSLGIENKHPKFQFTHKLTIHATISQIINFQQCCIANAK